MKSLVISRRVHRPWCSRVKGVKRARTVEWPVGAALSQLIPAGARPCGLCWSMRWADDDGKLQLDLWFVAMTDPFYGYNLGPLELVVHAPSACAGEHCTVHNPSSHRMANWPCVWRSDRKIVERKCPEPQCGHPDFDDLEFRTRTCKCDVHSGIPNAWFGDVECRADGVHGCCGCCQDGAREC